MRDVGGHTQLGHIGFVWPDTGDALDLFEMADAATLAEAVGCPGLTLSVDYSQGPAGHDLSALKSVGETESIATAGKRLAAQGAQGIVWACTSGSFIGGLDWCLDQRRVLQDQIGLPVTSGTLALIASGKRLGFRSVDVLSPYPDDVSVIFKTCLEEAGIKTASMRMLHSPGATASANLPLVEECRRFNATDQLMGDGVLIPDTAVNSLSLIADLEEALDKPVLTVNQACVFEGAALIGQSGWLAKLPAFRRFENCPEGTML